MSSTATETLTHETAMIRTAPTDTTDPDAEETHFARMAGLYAWILVTLAIFMIAGMLSGIQKSQAATEVDQHHVDSVSVSHSLNR
jgi:hypothetical protein